MRRNRISVGLKATLTVLAMTVLVGGTAAAQEKLLLSFSGKDGYAPFAGLILDASGNLYGTTFWGGAYDFGTVFELMPAGRKGWTEKVLHSFTGGYVAGGLIFDASGNLYGTTTGDGGTVFELKPKAGGGWAEKVLHTFSYNTEDGSSPEAGLIFDAVGNLYGTTQSGGTYNDGTVFELTPAASGGWTETILHDFDYNGTDGYGPLSRLIFDGSGNLYGTTSSGGAYNGGTVFELMPSASGGWTEAILHDFDNNGTDGYFPYAGVILDRAGRLYGTTSEGGTGACTEYGRGVVGCGTVFALAPSVGGSWTERVLHSFNYSDKDGAGPFAGLIFDGSGNLYGTTTGGGTDSYGTVFELTPKTGGNWTETVLYSFNQSDGYEPFDGSLIFDASGNLYGTTVEGGAFGYGTVFEITP